MITAKDVVYIFSAFAIMIASIAIAVTVFCVVNNPASYAPIAAKFMKAYNVEMAKP